MRAASACKIEVVS